MLPSRVGRENLHNFISMECANFLGAPGRMAEVLSFIPLFPQLYV